MNQTVNFSFKRVRLSQTLTVLLQTINQCGYVTELADNRQLKLMFKRFKFW
jgi:hypothetical protein